MSDVMTETALDVLVHSIEGVPTSDIEGRGATDILQSLVRLSRGKAVTILRRCEVDLSALEVALDRAHAGPAPHSEDTGRGLASPRGRVLSIAFDEAMSHNDRQVGTHHLLLAILSDRASVAQGVLSSFGVTLDRAREIARELERDTIPDQGNRQSQRPPQWISAQGERPGALAGPGLAGSEGGSPSCMSTTAATVMAGALAECEGVGSDGIGAEHILLSLVHLNIGVASALLARARIDRTAVSATLLHLIRESANAAHASAITRLSSSLRAFAAARDLAARDGAACVGTHHILLGVIFDEHSLGRRVLTQYGLGLERALAIKDELTKDGSTEP